MRTVYGEGPEPCDLMIVGERPGIEETRDNRPFAGPAGRELWNAFADAGLPGRNRCYATTAVKTFSTETPTQEELDHWRGQLLTEVRQVRPKVVVAIGAVAMRWFLGKAAGLDWMHGLAFECIGTGEAGILRLRRPIVVIPCFTPWAAIKQPELYQGKFRADVAAVKRVLDGTQSAHVVTRPADTLAAYDLRASSPTIEQRATQLIPGAKMGLDLEGSIESPECLTVSDDYASFLLDPAEFNHLCLVAQLKRAYMHNAVRDLRALWTLNLDIPVFEDSMLAAYLLSEPQGLKTLAYRLCGFDMDDYWDLIEPLDEGQVRVALEAAYHAHEKDPDVTKAAKKTLARRDKLRAALVRGRSSHGHVAVHTRERTVSEKRDRHRSVDDRLRQMLGAEIWPSRVVSGLGRLCATRDARRSLRARWQDSVNAAYVPLPPIPTWQSLPAAVGVPYACTDAFGHKKVWGVLQPRLKREGLWNVYQMDKAVIPFLARMESVGMLVDASQLNAISTDLHLSYVKVCGQIESILGYPLNPKAAEDVSETLFDELGVTPTKLTKSGKFHTTGDKHLEARKKEHEIIPLIIAGRELWKLKSSYADKLPSMLDATGRYHPDFGYTRTASGRLAETIILLIPKHSAWGKKIRKAFVAGPGHSLVSCDLAQIELRALAHLSGDKELLRVFREGLDPHAITAHRLLGAPAKKEDQDESQHRLPSKKVNFGAFMGLSELGLTEQIRAGGNPTWAVGCAACDYTGSDPRERPDHDRDCASRLFFTEYFRLYRGVRTYIDARHEEARRHGVVRDLFGRKIYVSGIWSSHRGVVGRFQRMAQATPVQATADGISKHWNAAMWAEMLTKRHSYYLEPYTRTHDDTVLEVSTRYADVTRSKMLRLVPQLLCIPVTADGKIGPDWGTMK